MKPITIDEANNAIIITRKFAEKASDPRTQEYAMLQQVRRDYPYLTVRKHTIKKNPNKECYRGLTYKYMEEFIKTYESKANVEKVLAELEELIFISQGHSKGYRYPTIKKWFIDKYPNFATFGMEINTTEERKVAELTFPNMEEAVA